MAAGGLDTAALGLQDLRIFAQSYPSQTLDLSRKGLTQVPKELPDCDHLEVSGCTLAALGVMAIGHG